MKIKSLAEPHTIKLFRYLYKAKVPLLSPVSIDESIALRDSVQHFLKPFFTFLISFISS